MTAITRFVTALLDSTQTSKYKVSMYAKAAEVGLPALFVDLRHESTHGEMPSLRVLRDAAEKGLEWLWRDYWEGMGEVGGNRIEAQTVREVVEGREEERPREVKEQREGGDVEAWSDYPDIWTGRAVGVI